MSRGGCFDFLAGSFGQLKRRWTVDQILDSDWSRWILTDALFSSILLTSGRIVSPWSEPLKFCLRLNDPANVCLVHG